MSLRTAPLYRVVPPLYRTVPHLLQHTQPSVVPHCRMHALHTSTHFPTLFRFSLSSLPRCLPCFAPTSPCCSAQARIAHPSPALSCAIVRARNTTTHSAHTLHQRPHPFPLRILTPPPLDTTPASLIGTALHHSPAAGSCCESYAHARAICAAPCTAPCTPHRIAPLHCSQHLPAVPLHSAAPLSSSLACNVALHFPTEMK